MDILDKYYVFCTLDESLIEPSYVLFSSLFKYNPYIKLHVHCINFHEDKLEQYTNNINKYWKDSIEIIPEQIHLNVTVPEFAMARAECMKHMDALMSKIIIADRHYKPYMFHLDIDMLIRSDFSELFQEYEEELIGYLYCYNSNSVNAGVMIIHTEKDISTNLTNYIQSYCQDKYTNEIADEGYITEQNLVIKNISPMYCIGKYIRTGFSLHNTKIAHFYGCFKPYSKWDVIRPHNLIMIPYAKEWLDIYDTLDPTLFQTISPIVEQHRNTINKLSPIYLKMYKQY